MHRIGMLQTSLVQVMHPGVGQNFKLWRLFLFGSNWDFVIKVEIIYNDVGDFPSVVCTSAETYLFHSYLMHNTIVGRLFPKRLTYYLVKCVYRTDFG